MDTDSKGDDAASSPSPPTAPSDPAPLLSALRDASSTEQVSAALAALAGAVVARSITVTKAEILVAAKAARAGLAAAGGGGGLWTKDCAVALKAVLQAFGKSGGIVAVPELQVGQVVVVPKPGSDVVPNVARVVAVGVDGGRCVRVELLCRKAAEGHEEKEEEGDVVQIQAVRQFPPGSAAVQILAAAMGQNVPALAGLAQGAAEDPEAQYAVLVSLFNLARGGDSGANIAAAAACSAGATAMTDVAFELEVAEAAQQENAVDEGKDSTIPAALATLRSAETLLHAAVAANSVAASRLQVREGGRY